MSSKNPKRSLTVLDVGHGSAAVLQDECGVVVIDTGRGPQVSRYLKSIKATEVESVLLSHSDADHIGGATTVLLAPSIKVKRLLINPDSTKTSDAFRQLIFALMEAEKRCGTVLEVSLTTSTQFQRDGAKIEVLFPPTLTAISGVGGNDVTGNRLTSNSMSVAIRVTLATTFSVLLGGDIEFGCLKEWEIRKVLANSNALVFPHHGGLPGDASMGEAALFAFQIATMVRPETVIFSIHRTKFGLPREDVLEAVAKAVKDVKFACTQLPERLRAHVAEHPAWMLHRGADGYLEGNIELRLDGEKLSIQFFKNAD